MGGRNEPSFLGLPGGQRNCPQSREVDRQLTKDKALDKSLIKILILGIGGAGKSTLMKQLRLLHGTPPSRQERELMTEVIHRQIILTIQILVKRVGEFCLKENPFVDEVAKEMVMSWDPYCRITPGLGEALSAVWAEDSVQNAWKVRDIEMVDSLPYFMEHLCRIYQPQYVPSHNDVIHAKVRTAGIHEVVLNYNNSCFQLIDVGGQRCERRKWINLFSNVRAVIFMAALSDYDQYVEENSTRNRMVEAVSVFNEICFHPSLKDATVFLFLNKSDIFVEKVYLVPINSVECFSDYRDLGSARHAIRYLMFQFIKENSSRSTQKLIITHIICALDTATVQAVFIECQKLVIWRGLQTIGMVDSGPVC